MKYLILFLLNISLLNLMGQSTGTLYFEPAPNNRTRFFFDENYFMVDKGCEFKNIERVSAFDRKTNMFEGEFKDFDNNGRLILTGQYSNGNKEGKFKAFHPNGALKWEATFTNNEATGPWKYYYPDSRPMLYITLNQPGYTIDQYWNRSGEQLVKDGEGVYDIDLPIIGFTEHGFTRFNRRGKVKKGFPDGIWNLYFINESKKKEKIHFYTELYENGEFKGRRISDNFSGVYIPDYSLILTPDSYFPRAELLLSKNCSFDEFTGFNIFLSEKFKNYLTGFGAREKMEYDFDMSYTVQVLKDGSPTRAKLTSFPQSFTAHEKVLFTKMIESIYYYLPSYYSGEPIDDTLTVSFSVKIEGPKTLVTPAQIKREKGM